MSWSLEIPSSVAAPRIFKGFVLNWHEIGPKVLPDFVVGGKADKIEGGVGSMRELNFSPAMPFSLVKERIDFLDMDKFEIKATLVEGGGLGENIESGTSHVKVESRADGGSVLKVEMRYKTLPGVEIPDEEIAKAKEAMTGSVEAAEAYLQANPEAYA